MSRSCPKWTQTKLLANEPRLVYDADADAAPDSDADIDPPRSRDGS